MFLCKIFSAKVSPSLHAHVRLTLYHDANQRAMLVRAMFINDYNVKYGKLCKADGLSFSTSPPRIGAVVERLHMRMDPGSIPGGAKIMGEKTFSNKNSICSMVSDTRQGNLGMSIHARRKSFQN